MSHTAFNSQKLFSLVAAVAVTLALQGSVLAGFDRLGQDVSQMQASNSVRAITLPTVEIVHARG